MKKIEAKVNANVSKVRSEMKEQTLGIRKPKDRTIAIKVQSCFSKDLRKNLKLLFIKIEKMENEEEKTKYTEKINQIFSNLNHQIQKVRADLAVAEMFDHLTDEQIEMLKQKFATPNVEQ